VNSNYKELNLEQEMRSDESHYKIYKPLAYLHRKEPALTQGSYTSFTMNNDTVLGVIRSSDSRIVLFLINFEDATSQTVDLSDYDLPVIMKLKVASLGSRSSLKEWYDFFEYFFKIAYTHTYNYKYYEIIIIKFFIRQRR